MAVDEDSLVQSDSNGEPSYSVMACSHVLVLHSTGHYNDSSTIVMMGSGQHQYTRPHAVCSKFADALPMVNHSTNKQAVPVLHVCAQSEGLQHVQLAVVVAHQLPIVVVLLPFGLPAMPHLHQTMLGISVGLVHLLKGRSPQVGVGSAYRSLPVEGRLQGMLGSSCCFLVPLPGLLSNLVPVTCRLCGACCFV